MEQLPLMSRPGGSSQASVPLQLRQLRVQQGRERPEMLSDSVRHCWPHRGFLGRAGGCVRRNLTDSQHSPKPRGSVRGQSTRPLPRRCCQD